MSSTKTTLLVGETGRFSQTRRRGGTWQLIAGRVLSTTGTVTFYINGQTEFLTLKAGDPFLFPIGGWCGGISKGQFCRQGN